jgi:hypothetical protein
MPLSFLNPWLWLGALAVAAPIWLHLRRRQETNLIEFSALRFLDDSPEPRQSPFRLRDLLLFALRTLALLLLVAAFSWPYLRGANMAPVKESRVYILDNTLSRQANHGFEHDRDQVLGEVSKAGPEIQVAVIELAAVPHTTVSFGDDRETARQALRQMKPSFQRGSYLAAFRQANSLLANSLGDHRRIIFLGDNQENQWNENVNTPAFLKGVQVDLPKAPAQNLPNLSLSEPRIQRIFLGDKSLVNFTVKLTHTGEAKSANILLQSNGQVVFNRPVELEKQPETILLRAQWEAEPTSWLSGEVVVEGSPDALPADNRVFFSLAPVIEGKVALLAQSQYLRLALSPEIMRGQWATRIIEPTKLGDELGANQDADVLCLESNYLQSADARKLLWRYLTNGRGVLLLVNRVTPAITGFLRELGFETGGMINAEAAEKFQFVLSNHPVFHPFLSPDFGNLMDVKVSRYFQLTSSQAMPLIFSQRGGGLFFQGTKLQGKLYVAAFGLDREHTSWPIHQTFIPFLDLTLQNARAEDPTPTIFEPGELAMVQLPANSTVREVVLRPVAKVSVPTNSAGASPAVGPGGDTTVHLTTSSASEDAHRTPVEQGRAQVLLPDRPGLYALTYDESPQIEKVFSINPSPKESELAFIDSPEAMKVWQANGPNGKSAPAPNRAKITLAAILQQRFWWWMVVGGLVVLILETVLAELKQKMQASPS